MGLKRDPGLGKIPRHSRPIRDAVADERYFEGGRPAPMPCVGGKNTVSFLIRKGPKTTPPLDPERFTSVR